MSNEHIQCHAIRSQNSHPRFLKIKDAVANENDMILKTPTEEHFCSSKNTPKQIKAQLRGIGKEKSKATQFWQQLTHREKN